MSVNAPTSSHFVMTKSNCEQNRNSFVNVNGAFNSRKDVLVECLIRRDIMIENMELKQNITQTMLQSAKETRYHALASLKTVKVNELQHRYKEKALIMEIERLQSEIALLRENLKKNMDELAALRENHASTLCQMEIDLKAKTEELKISNSTVTQLTVTNQKLSIRLGENKLTLQQYVNEANILKSQSKQLEDKSVLFMKNAENDSNQLLINDLIDINRKVLKLLKESIGQCAVLAENCSIRNGAANNNSKFEDINAVYAHGSSNSFKETEDFFEVQQFNKDAFEKHIRMSEKQNEMFLETISNYKSITKNLTDENWTKKAELLASYIRYEQLNEECSRLKSVNKTRQIEHALLEINHKILQDKCELMNKQLEQELSEKRAYDTDRLTKEEQTSQLTQSFTTALRGGPKCSEDFTWRRPSGLNTQNEKPQPTRRSSVNDNGEVSNTHSSYFDEEDSSDVGSYTDNEEISDDSYSDGENSSGKDFESDSSGVFIVEDYGENEIINIDSGDTDESDGGAETLKVSNLGNIKETDYIKEHHVEEITPIENIDNKASNSTRI